MQLCFLRAALIDQIRWWRTWFWLVCLVVLVEAPAMAQHDIEVSNAWARGTVPAQKVSGAYLEIRSAAASRLVGTSSPVASQVKIHNMMMDGNVMKMFPVDAVALPAGKTVKFAPGGYHIMLMGLKQQLKKGETIPITLRIEGADKKIREVEVKVEVRDLALPATSHNH